MERETPPEVTNPGAFKKGHEKLGGRKVGTHNAATKLLKECILMAAELEGSDGNGKDGLIGFLRRRQGRYSRLCNVAGPCPAAAADRSRGDMGVEMRTSPLKKYIASWKSVASISN